MNFDTYQEQAEETSVAPEEFPEWVTPRLVLWTLGSGGEVGEVQEKVKKAIREDDTSYLDDLEDELGDVLWYWTMLADELGFDAEKIARANLLKLQDRQERGKLHGEGDNR